MALTELSGVVRRTALQMQREKSCRKTAEIERSIKKHRRYVLTYQKMNSFASKPSKTLLLETGLRGKVDNAVRVSTGNCVCWDAKAFRNNIVTEMPPPGATQSCHAEGIIAIPWQIKIPPSLV